MAWTIWRKNSLKIVSIPESINENEGVVLKIANVLDVQVKPDDIKICHRVKRKFCCFCSKQCSTTRDMNAKNVFDKYERILEGFYSGK